MKKTVKAKTVQARKKTNSQDTTLRNNRARVKEIAELQRKLSALEGRVRNLEQSRANPDDLS